MPEEPRRVIDITPARKVQPAQQVPGQAPAAQTSPISTPEVAPSSPTQAEAPLPASPKPKRRLWLKALIAFFITAILSSAAYWYYLTYYLQAE